MYNVNLPASVHTYKSHSKYVCLEGYSNIIFEEMCCRIPEQEPKTYFQMVTNIRINNRQC